MEKPEKVRDTQQREYELGELLGRGGEGEVYRVKNSPFAVKLLSKVNPRQREHLHNQLTKVKRLDLQGLPIARPQAMLAEPHLGYVMELLTDMVSLKTLMQPPEEDFVPWYGLRRRLRLLARVADILANIHGKGMAYADPSPNNIFISDSTDAEEVWLIDADNLHVQSSSAHRLIYTPKYGAPELVTEKGCVNTLTDAHAFAVIAFKTLALVHPLIGDYVNESEPELEDQAMAGQLPWIDNPDDDSNASSNGLPRDFILSPKLHELCQRSFTEGLSNPQQRPSVNEWAEKLHAAADATLTCPACKGSYYFVTSCCPWCDEPRPAFALLRVSLWDHEKQKLFSKPNGKEVIVGQMVLAETESREIGKRWLFGQMQGTDTPCLSVEIKNQYLLLHTLENQQYLLKTPEGEENLQQRQHPVDLSQASKYELHLDSLDKLHRVIRFDYRSHVE